MRHFLNTLVQIVHSESVGSVKGVWRHLNWQARKLSHQFPCEIPLGSSRLFVDQADSVAALVNAMGTYDFNNMSFLQTMLVRFGGVFVDVGANIGPYTLIASEVSSCRVISIEPHPSAFRMLTNNIRWNRRTNVTSFDVALSDKNGCSWLTDGCELSVNRIAAPDSTGGMLPIRTRTLQSVCSELGVIPDFIKIDVEGHEGSVLNGLGAFASAAKAVWIEGGERGEIARRMSAAGYLGPYFVHYKTMMIDQLAAARREDPIFLRRDFLEDVLNCGFRLDCAASHLVENPDEPIATRNRQPQFQ
jgi:FkbM family methyltransferase